MLSGNAFAKEIIGKIQSLRPGKIIQIAIEHHPLQPREHIEHYVEEILKECAKIHLTLQGGDLALVAMAIGFEETDFPFQYPPAPYRVRVAVTPMERYPQEREGA